MGLDTAASKLMGMSEDTWIRHANPWSGWTRLSVFPLIALAAWSRIWIGDWAWLFGFFVVVWIWLNPRLFPPPKDTHNWMSKGVFGERVWLNRKSVPIPERHARMAFILSTISGIALLPFGAGLVFLDISLAALGMIVSVMAKLWFMDRMVWLYTDMRTLHQPYAAWMRSR